MVVPLAMEVRTLVFVGEFIIGFDIHTIRGIHATREFSGIHGVCSIRGIREHGNESPSEKTVVDRPFEIAAPIIAIRHPDDDWLADPMLHTPIIAPAFQPRLFDAGSTLVTMISDSTIEAIRRFSAERDWDGFHTPENLAKSISIEAGELLECFQWTPGSSGEAGYPPAEPQEIRDELADVLTYCIMMADRLGADMDDIILDKLERTKRKYPASAVRDDPAATKRLHEEGRKE